MMKRLLRPRSLAVVGGGAWCASVVRQAGAMGWNGTIHPVHPTAPEVGGLPALPSLDALPSPPDAVFLGINRHATIEAVRALSRIGAGGAVCFASGFAEARAEDPDAPDLQADLVAAAGDMPILGPNCYGFVNALDRVAIWPDQHGARPAERGVAVLTQSSNIAINVTMTRRALPLAYVVACGNMAQTSQAALARALLEDDRVTAIGLHVEGFGSVPDWEALAEAAHAKGVPLVALKTGASAQARGATISHTASLAGTDAGAGALLARLGIARVPDLPILLETLKLLHVHGPLRSGAISAVSCSGGEAALVADMAQGTGLAFAPLTDARNRALRDALGPMVALANPLDYHTYVWRDVPRMAAAWRAMTGPDVAMTLSVVDYPVTDATDWTCATEAALATGPPFAVAATLPELMPEPVADRLAAGGIVPFHGLREALAALDAARQVRAPAPAPAAPPHGDTSARILTEPEAKALLATHGVPVPDHVAGPKADLAAKAAHLRGPLAVKSVGPAHKSETAGVILNVAREHLPDALARLPTEQALVERMVPDPTAELLVGIVDDPPHGRVLTLAAGGTLAELLRDKAHRLLPVTADEIDAALASLRIDALLAGHRGGPAADRRAVVTAILAIQDCALAKPLLELEVNPLICTPTEAVAADALIRKATA